MKKLLICFIPAVILLTGCGKENNGAEGIRKDGESVTEIVSAAADSVVYSVLSGSVKEVNNGRILISTPEDTWVSSSDIPEEIMPGDHVKVYFDGQIMETYPVQLGTVYGVERITEEQGIELNSAYDPMNLYREKSWEYVSGTETADTVIDPENPEIMEIAELPDDFWRITREYDNSDCFYEAIYHTVSDELLGPIVVYMDKAGTIIGLAYRE